MRGLLSLLGAGLSASMSLPATVGRIAHRSRAANKRGAHHVVNPPGTKIARVAGRGLRLFGDA